MIFLLSPLVLTKNPIYQFSFQNLYTIYTDLSTLISVGNCACTYQWQKYSFIELDIQKLCKALNDSTYIALRIQKLRNCKHGSYHYFCEELFVVNLKQNNNVNVPCFQTCLCISLKMYINLNNTVTTLIIDHQF